MQFFLALWSSSRLHIDNYKAQYQQETSFLLFEYYHLLLELHARTNLSFANFNLLIRIIFVILLRTTVKVVISFSITKPFHMINFLLSQLPSFKSNRSCFFWDGCSHQAYCYDTPVISFCVWTRYHLLLSFPSSSHFISKNDLVACSFFLCSFLPTSISSLQS